MRVWSQFGQHIDWSILESKIDQPMVVVVATKIAASLTMRNDADPTFKWDVTMGLDCPIKVMTDEHQVHQV